MKRVTGACELRIPSEVECAWRVVQASFCCVLMR